ncbi:Fc receptor-like protein 5 [Salmo salar]|uniref:Fc receptor-like protein 5 n=1 Tax=Salmo salar TaxID=8030 RepID=A0A1S3QIT7_SALSA|nr:Fc receptor-like protein 5 [Salmo salar]|eukprot:XP_014039264.1 PREDICTED: Fc receptor-like protein 5 [Salmo salar]
MEHTCFLLLLFSTLVYSGLGHDGVSLRVLPDRSQFFEYESLIVSCEVQGNSAGWTQKRYTSTGKISACGTDWGKQQGFSCIVSLILSDSGVYWCESGSGVHSNTVNITVHAGAVILESPALHVTEGRSVTLRCRHRKDKEMKVTPSDLTADFYKDGSLVRTETTGEMTIPAVSKSDEGLYKCSTSEGESPERLMTLTVLSPLPVSLSVRPNRSQFFEYESLIVSCEVQGNSAGWTLKRYTSTGKISACGTDWGKQQGFSCIVSLILSDSGVYWCESGSGVHSNAVNITVHAGAVILESPVLPVTEGRSVTLRCRHRKDKEMKVTPSDLTADFYKDGSLVRTETTGEMTIPAVSKSDEGLYKCSTSEGESPERLMTLTVPASIPDPSTVPVLSVSLPRLLGSLLVVSPYLLVTVVLLLKCNRRKGSR